MVFGFSGVKHADGFDMAWGSRGGRRDFFTLGVFGDDGLNPGTWSEKSGAASGREKAARVLLETTNSDATTIELLKPYDHLTSACWRIVCSITQPLRMRKFPLFKYR
jgi:hypothetical protein